MRRTRWVSGNWYVATAARACGIETDSYRQIQEHIYSATPDASLLIGKRNLGHISNYYPGEVITDEEVTAVQAAAEKHKVDVLNTR